MWHKLALNCVVNPLTGLLDCLNGDLPLGGEKGVAPRLLAECDQVARTLLGADWPYSAAELLAAARELVRATASNSSSLREDLRHGRETEITRLNLAVAKVGRRLGIECPVNESLGHMISLLTNNATL
jgi:2-dehydropantoate 2-reductase